MSRRVALTQSYIFALAAAAALILAGAAFVDNALRDLRGDGPLVNIAGRQRMLSQQIAKGALVVMHTPDEPGLNGPAPKCAMPSTSWPQTGVSSSKGEPALRD